MRLLQCFQCKTVNELPDFDGPPALDVLLETLIEEQHTTGGEPHSGNMLFVEDEQWRRDPVRQEILARLWDQDSGFDPEFYASKDTYREDAMKCFNSHQRPEGACIDWKADNKRIGNPTKRGWQEGPKVYLCDFCPVASWVATEIRFKKGQYK